MDTVIHIVETFLGFLLQLFELFVSFIIGALNLILEFARTVVDLAV